MKYVDKSDGFTIVEVMIALSVLALSVVGIMSMQTTSIGNNASARVLTAESSLISQHIETLMALNEGHGWLQDTNGNGTDQDPDKNGEDEVDDNADGTLKMDIPGAENTFGLTDTFADPYDPSSAIVADNSSTVGDYTILWNVAVNEPLPNVDTIRITVVRRDTFFRRPVSVDYFRAKVF